MCAPPLAVSDQDRRALVRLSRSGVVIGWPARRGCCCWPPRVSRTRKRPGGWGWLRTRCGRGGAVSSPVGWAGWAPSRRAGAPSGACRRTRRRRSADTLHVEPPTGGVLVDARSPRQGHHRRGRAGVAAVARRRVQERSRNYASTWIPLRRRWCSASTPRSKPWTAPSRRCRTRPGRHDDPRLQTQRHRGTSSPPSRRHRRGPAPDAAPRDTGADVLAFFRCAHPPRPRRPRHLGQPLRAQVRTRTMARQPRTPTMAPALHTHQSDGSPSSPAKPSNTTASPASPNSPHRQLDRTLEPQPPTDLDQTPQPHHRPNPPRTHHTQPDDH